MLKRQVCIFWWLFIVCFLFVCFVWFKFHDLPIFTPQGLSSEQVIEQRTKYGNNELTPPKTTPIWVRFLKTLFMGFSMLLWAGAVMCIGVAIASMLDDKDGNNYATIRDNVSLLVYVCVCVFCSFLFVFYCLFVLFVFFLLYCLTIIYLNIK